MGHKQVEENRLLVTSSILDSLRWVETCPPSWKTSAIESLKATIRREPYTTSPAAQRGIDFEDSVYKAASDFVHKGTQPTGHKVFVDTVLACADGRFQKQFKKKISVGGYDVLIYCKADVVHNYPSIIDLKTTGAWKGKQKYLNGWQHILYSYAAGIQDFMYLVVLFDGNTSDVPRMSYRIPAPRMLTEDAEKIVHDGILHLFSWLRNNNLWDDYNEIYSQPWRKR